MTTSRNYCLKVLATGFMVLVFFTIVLFWGRYNCEAIAQIKMPREARYMWVSPSRLLPEAVENDPNADRPSIASGGFQDDVFGDILGVFDYVKSKAPGGARTDVLQYEKDKTWMYFDRARGQLVFCVARLERRERDGRMVERITRPYYAGPEGIADTPSQDLGCFVDPLIRERHRPVVVYDRKQRRFFAIDQDKMEVRSGPQLAQDATHEPVRIMDSQGPEGLDVHWRPTMRRVLREDQEGSEPKYDWRLNMPFGAGFSWQYAPVVAASGRIDLLDLQTLGLLTGKAALPAPAPLFGDGGARPEQLLAYDVAPVSVGNPAEYVGMLAVAVSRQGTSMSLAIFDKDGKRVGGNFSKAVSYQRMTRAVEEILQELRWGGEPEPIVATPTAPSALAVFRDVPGGKLLAAGQYALENLHPLGLTMVSFFAVNHVEARASHRALFLIPNSFAAMHRDMVQHDIVTQFLRALVMMLPAVLVAIFLTWRVIRDAGIVGLSANARAVWLLATLMFGIPAYITYRLTRPAVALVTCASCGLPRRPDMDRCHRCAGPWAAPHLRPPAWRVLDGGQEEFAEPPMSIEEAAAE
ncbi:MAG: hypothetical protein JSW27_19525 [Phycisphaerales bacterium]|nr:MAG: hypothetical protein JSW27_19525 [Phycisphaerales bacterium]